MERFLRAAKKAIPKAVFHFFEPAYHFLLAFLAALYYGFPSRRMKVIGITGTSGKTTTVEFLHEIFYKAGYRTASLSSLRFKIGAKEEPNMLKMTMPGRFFVQKFLYEAKRAGCQYVFLEVTSEGVKQFRHKFTTLYAAIFTNLSEEHIEAHGGFENYRAAKGKLFEAAPLHVLNADDPHLTYFFQIPGRKKVLFRASDIPKNLWLKVAGEFNKMNAMAAIAFSRHEGIRDKISLEALYEIEYLPGRMEYIPTGKNFGVLVDYAFLPQTLRTIYEEAKASSLKGLVCVIGATGGGRDKWKRPAIGDTAAAFCRKVIVTNEDPYDEDPLQIMDEVAGAHGFEKILDRREAIRQALKAAEPGETVVITGKGAEPWIMGANGKKNSWDDRQIVREELQKL